MKKFLIVSGIILALSFTFNSTNAQRFYIKVRPVAPLVVRPVAPSPLHIWVADEWAWRGGAYVIVPGHWEAPRGRYRAWIPGHWVHTRRGEYWVRGHWR